MIDQQTMSAARNLNTATDLEKIFKQHKDTLAAQPGIVAISEYGSDAGPGMRP